jgi:hypothetical protein
MTTGERSDTILRNKLTYQYRCPREMGLEQGRAS